MPVTFIILRIVKTHKKGEERVPNKFCPHCGERNGFQVDFNVFCRIRDQEEKGYLRTCKDCGGRLIVIQKDERISGAKEKQAPDGR